MEEIVACIATKLAECLWDPISHHARYLFCFNTFIGDVEKAKGELQMKLADVNMRKEEADRRIDKEIMPSVKKWLEEVNAILEEVQKLQQELEGRGNKCFNVSLRYSLAKQMEDKANMMKELKSKSSFEPFSRLIPLPGINAQFSSKEVMDFKSRKSTYNSLLEAIKDCKNKMVGLYGIGGSGKTTLAIEVGKKVEQLKLFDKVVKVVVSRPPNVGNIQEEIKEKTGLQFDEKTNEARAQRLISGLIKMKVLIILDDVWSNLNLQEIGIPPNENCRILLTTRNRDVCDSMCCERTFELSLLTREEAWDLFMMYANLTNDSFNKLDDVGRKIVDECKGLPIAVVTVGSALRGKGTEAWKSTLRRLQHSVPLDVDESSRGPYACLKLSYDYLPSLAQQLFLLCSIFPEDHEIHTEDLIRFAKGTLKFHEIAYTMEDARNEILVSIKGLLDSCLLMHTDKQVCVKMHDLVRDVALWITKKQDQAILVDRDVVSRMLGENETLRETKAISLWNLEKNFKLSNQLRSPILEILLLHSPEGFTEDFGGIESLKVLALVKFSFEWELFYAGSIQWLMPQSILSSLKNLHTLCFRGIALGNISFLCHFKRLEILDLRCSQFDELPGGIVDMKKLKILDVFGCEIEKNPLQVIQRCEQLEELYILEKKSDILENFSLSGLKRYVIYYLTSGLDIFSFFDSCDEPLRALSIQGFEGSDLNSSIIFSLSMSQLYIGECPKLTTIFPHATSLSLTKLRILGIYGCNKVKWIFSHSLAVHCPSLEELSIYGCNELERLIQEEVAHGDHLLHQRESHHDLPNYPDEKETEKITIRDCSEPESLDEEASHEDILLPLLLKLKHLSLVDLPKLREIFGGRFKHKLESLHNKQEYSPHVSISSLFLFYFPNTSLFLFSLRFHYYIKLFLL
ncbi:hypothetical protein QN277_018581 [Acacia crassicarpa]|uniref:NB-ARC domain-containing protein n=1 Tax=Acacia crassicarpa TaxID=499986 RepID=A0AAE1KJM8_9FABA|nr:hypothetical protein QN277_018581 [Acacia crassicarpa]